ncbi:hypothetical protein [Streptacidiphilus melanogenes]|uniref:hypothetical protein n=1 Tax=Streptacidiphilus melanogenes TaxID=411235 RepID=UPI001269CD9E|nr:hypothetical protein [Streptacidiphilus melanogenes]
MTERRARSTAAKTDSSSPPTASATSSACSACPAVPTALPALGVVYLVVLRPKERISAEDRAEAAEEAPTPALSSDSALSSD